MKYARILEILAPEEAQLLSKFVAEDIIKEKLVAPILKQVMHVDEHSSEPLIRIGVNKLNVLIYIIKIYDLKNLYPAAYSQTIKRLISKNGHETFNELLTHSILLSVFNSYRPRPFYEEGEDGIIIDGDSRIPVEIKSRFPQKYELLHSLIDQISKAFTNFSSPFDLAYQIRFTNIKGLNHQAVQKEMAFIHASLASLAIIDLAKLIGQQLYLNSSGAAEGVAYEILLLPFEPDPERTISLPMKASDDLFAESINAEVKIEVDSPKMSRFRKMTAIISIEVKKMLASAIINGCFNNSKNIPKEPRVIAIYTTRGDESIEFIKRLVDDYINNHPGTMILLIKSSFSEDPEWHFHITYERHGVKLENIFNTQYNLH